MAHLLEAAYLDIEWRGYGCARSITVAPEPIEIEQLPDGSLTIETQVFNGLCPWVGLRLLDELNQIQPVFEDLEGNIKPMLQIADVHGGHWWVQNDGWDPEKKSHLSELHRSMGQFKVILGAHTLVINNIVDGLGRAEVEDYLRDFQSELVWLVMGFSGATTGTTKGSTANLDMVQALDSFVAAARKVLSCPAQQISEIQAEDRTSRLRPNAATFRQYFRNPTAQRLIGRMAEETPNIAENRYLRHMVQICGKLAEHAVRAVDRYANSFALRARIEGDRSVSYSEMTHRQVDPEIFERQMTDIQKKLDKVSKFSLVSSEPGRSVSNWSFRPGEIYGNIPNQMFYFQEDGGSTSNENIGSAWSVLQVPERLADLIQQTRGFCEHYLLDGVAHAKMERTMQGKRYRRVNFTSIYKVQPFTTAPDRKAKKRDYLEKNGWRIALSAKERQEMCQEADTARSRERVYEEHARRALQVLEKLNQCKAELRSQDLGWERLRVPSSPVIPMGMRFAQSPLYATCQTAFSKVAALAKGSGLPEAALDNIEKMGVLHASAVYERWCLIKIISVLMEDYRFLPEDGWQERLICAVTGKPQSVKLMFHRDDVEWIACLEIQPELANGRRPDFRLRFLRGAVSALRNHGEYSPLENHEDNRHKENLCSGLVMDAKFRTKWRYGELGRTLSNLIDTKGYDQDGDRVYILHPAPFAILRPSSPLMWGPHCDYGQDGRNAHNRGVVHLAPSSGDINLRRLIAILLQANFSEPIGEPGESSVIHTGNSFCINCGYPYKTTDLVQRHTQKGNNFWTFVCPECRMRVTRTHCFGCIDGTLFKNGLHLTYHRTVADQITNIVCPNCEKYFDQDIHSSRNISSYK